MLDKIELDSVICASPSQNHSLVQRNIQYTNVLIPFLQIVDLCTLLSVHLVNTLN